MLVCTEGMQHLERYETSIFMMMMMMMMMMIFIIYLGCGALGASSGLFAFCFLSLLKLHVLSLDEGDQCVASSLQLLITKVGQKKIES
jgi:ABC-type antimicrobial peptide transport system permease subunit